MSHRTAEELLRSIESIHRWRIAGMERGSAERYAYVGLYCQREEHLEHVREIWLHSLIDVGFINWVLRQVTIANRPVSVPISASELLGRVGLVDGIAVRPSGDAASCVSLTQPSISFRAAPGFLATPMNMEGEISRLYLAIRPSQAPWMLETIHGEFMSQGLRVGVKVLANPVHYIRADAAVVYVERAERQRALAIVERSAAAAGICLRDITPLGTCPFGRGMAWADGFELGGAAPGPSFGQWLARAMVDYAFDHGAADATAIEAFFSARGRDLAEIYHAR